MARVDEKEIFGLKDVTPTPPGSLHSFEKKGLANWAFASALQ
jgi:hypothetical protein